MRDDGSVVGFGNDTSLLAARAPSARGRIETPTVLDLPPQVTQMAVGYDMAYALLADGTLLAWGTNDRGQFGRGVGSSRTPGNPMRTYTPLRVTLPKPITQVVAAGHHGLALAADGTVLTWGDLPKPAFFIRPQMQWFFSAGVAPHSRAARQGEACRYAVRTRSTWRRSITVSAVRSATLQCGACGARQRGRSSRYV